MSAARKSSVPFSDMPKISSEWRNIGMQSAHGNGIVPEEADMEKVMLTLNQLREDSDMGVDQDPEDILRDAIDADYHLGQGGNGMFSYSTKYERSANNAIEDWARQQTGDWSTEGRMLTETEDLYESAKDEWREGWADAVLDMAERKGAVLDRKPKMKTGMPMIAKLEHTGSIFQPRAPETKKPLFTRMSQTMNRPFMQQAPRRQRRIIA